MTSDQLGIFLVENEQLIVWQTDFLSSVIHGLNIADFGENEYTHVYTSVLTDYWDGNYYILP